METKSSLNEKRNNTFKQMQDLMTSRGGVLSAEDQATFDKMFGVTEEYRVAMENLNKLAAIDEMADAVEERVAVQAKDKPTYERAFVNWLKGSVQPEERTILQSGQVQHRGTDTQVVGTPGLGGYLVPEEWAAEIYKIMAAYGGVLQVADIISTDSGATFNFPITNDTVEAAIVNEIGSHAVSDSTLTNATMGSFMFSTGIMKASVQLIRDSKYNVAEWIRYTLGERMGKGTNKKFTLGAGTTEPFGVVVESGLGATHSAISRAKLVELKYAVTSPYRMNGTWMMNSVSMGQVCALAFGSGDDRPLFQGGDARTGQPDRIEGHPVVINEQMDSVASTKKPVLFGDFKHFKVRRIGGFEIFPFNELFMATLEKGWLGYAAWDSKLFYNGAVKHLVIS